jgi:hypothetical protein
MKRRKLTPAEHVIYNYGYFDGEHGLAPRSDRAPAGGQCVGATRDKAAAKYRLARPDSNGQTAAGGVL